MKMEIITINKAREQNLLRYFTGSPCKRGHIAERSTANKTCLVCKRDKERLRRNAKHLSRRTEYRDYEGPIVTRREAKELGISRYFTGKRCKHGHLEQRRTATKRCMECDRQAQRKWKAALPKKTIEQRCYAMRIAKLRARTRAMMIMGRCMGASE